MRALIERPEDLGRLIRRVRTEADISQRELAERLGVSQRYVYELETGRPKRIDRHYFQVLALLGITITANVDTEPRDGE